MAVLATFADRLMGQPLFQLMQEADELSLDGTDVVHYEIGGLDFNSPAAAVSAAKLALDAGETGYTDSRGLREFREAIADHTERTLGFRPSLPQILVCPANAVVEFLVRCVADHGDEVIIPDPSFPTYRAVLSHTAVVTRTVKLEEQTGFDMEPEKVRAMLNSRTRLIIVNSPGNPTGSCLSEEAVTEITRAAQQHNCLLLSDEVYAGMSYEIPHHSPAQHDQCRERTVVLGSLSKSHAMAGWRLGYAIGPEPVIEKMGLLLQTTLLCLPPFAQRGGIAALAQGDRISRELMPQLRERRDRLVHGLQRLPGLECRVPDGAFFAFPRVVSTTMDDVSYARRLLAEEAVCVVPGSHFGAAGSGFVRFSYSAAPITRIDAALERLERFHAKHFEGAKVPAV